MDKVIQKVAIANNETRCPVCNGRLTEKKLFPVLLKSINGDKERQAECELLYCRHCNIPIINKEIGRAIYLANDNMTVNGFATKEKCSLLHINSMMYSVSKREKALTPKPVDTNHDHSDETVDIGSTVWRTERHLFGLWGDNPNKCPACGSSLMDDYTDIPISREKAIRIHGKYCKGCRCLYIFDREKVVKLLEDNAFAKDFSIDGRYLWNITEMQNQEKKRRQAKALEEKRKRKLQNTAGSMIMICVYFSDGTEQDYIVTNDLDAANLASDVLHYSSREARELLTAAMKDTREKQGTLNGKGFTVTHSLKTNSTDSLDKFLLTDIQIGKGGGYISSIKNANYELVDVLMYSPFTDCYELVHATYNRSMQSCFVDISVFRNFINNYGNPGLPLFNLKSDTNKIAWNDLNEESILRSYSYTVASEDNLSNEFRHDLLAEMIDLGIVDIPKIVKLLDFFIDTHPNEKDIYARLKWEQDKKFVMNYKFNPNRFLIADLSKPITRVSKK